MDAAYEGVLDGGGWAEGFRNVAEFKKSWTDFHGSFDPQAQVWVVRFKLA